jgi:aminoglycoside 6'-N-acetyltransferase
MRNGLETLTMPTLLVDAADTEAISFRPLSLADVPSIARWLADPKVAHWWPVADLGLMAIEVKYSPIIDGSEPVRRFIVVVGSIDIGYIQAYRLDDHPTYARKLQVDNKPVAPDLFIGEADWRGRGWGEPVLRTFLDQIGFGVYGTELAVITSTPTNQRAICVYERCSFRWLRTLDVVDEDNPLDSGEEYVMVLPRPDINAADGE